MRPWLKLLRRTLVFLAKRRGDKDTWGTRWLWFHVYRWGFRSYGTGQWYEPWHVLVGYRTSHRSFHLCDLPEPRLPGGGEKGGPMSS